MKKIKQTLRKPSIVEEVAALFNAPGGSAQPGTATKSIEDVLAEFARQHAVEIEKMIETRLAEVQKNTSTAQRQRAIDALLAKGRGAAVIKETGHVEVHPDEQLGLDVAFVFRACAKAARSQTSPLEVLKEWAQALKSDGDDRGERIFMSMKKTQEKALSASSSSGAGMLIPEPMLQEITLLLRAAVIIETAGVQHIDMPNGNLTVLNEATSVTASYGQELANITPSQGSLEAQKMSAKKLTSLTIISNDLLAYNSIAADQWVRDQIVRTFAVRKDLGLLRDDGESNTMKGIRWLTIADNVVPRSTDGGGSVTLDTVNNDLQDCISRLEQGNIPMVRPTWAMSPRTKNFLMKLLNGLGLPVFGAEMAEKGTLKGYPFLVSTNVPNNLGTGGDESELYFFDAAQFIVGEARNLEIMADVSATIDVNGTPQNVFQRDAVAIRAIAAHDCMFRYQGAESTVVTQVDWYT